MTRKEQLQHMEEKFQGDFWAAVEFLITEEAWGMSEFEEADIVDIFNESFDNPVEENMDYLRNLVTMAEKAVKDDVAYQNMTQQDQEMGRYAERHEGISAFFSFLRDSLKDPSVLDSEAGRRAWVNDLEDCLSTTAGNDYEIPGRLTKSGNPELYTIRREWFTAPDGEEDYLIVHG